MRNRVVIFLMLTFSLSWGCSFWLMANGGYTNPFATYILIGVMMIPAACSIITRLITHEGFRDTGLRIRLRQGGWLSYVSAWAGISLLIALGAALFFILNPGDFDPTLSAYRQASGGLSDTSDGQLLGSAIINILIGAAISPLVNGIPCLGEELGWRGYLLPKLCDLMGEGPANLTTGIIWGIWHAPMIAMGHNYGMGYPGYPWVGIVAMVVFCIAVGGILGRLSMLAESVWPAVIGHAVLNGLAAAGTLFMAVDAVMNPFIGPLPVGIVGGIGLLIAGVYCIACAFARPVYQTQHDIFIRY